MSGIGIFGFDNSTLLGYFNAKLATSAAQIANASHSSSNATANSTTHKATANDAPPWENLHPPSQQAQANAVLGLKNFFDTSNVPSLTTSADQKTEQDNQKLFSLYSAVNNLSLLATLSQSKTATAGQLAGYNTRFQQGLQQVQSFIGTETFNNFSLQAATPSASEISQIAIPFSPSNYTGGTVVSDANLSNALGGVSASDSFDISVKKNGVTTDVSIDLSQVQGALTADNIISYVNQQLSADGFSTRFKRVITSGSIDDPTKASYGISITTAPSEKITLSSAAATPALYLAGNSGSAVGSTTKSGDTTTTTAPDQQSRLVKLTNLDSSPQGVFNATVNPATGTTTAQATVVDANGNVYIVGNATGNFGNELNQGTQDVYLTKYDSAGNLQWTQLVGSAGSASGYSLALDPSTGDVVVAGSTTADLTTTAIANGNADSFVAKYDASGNQSWVQQIQTLNANQANAVSVDASGNVYLGGQVTGTIGAGQTNAGGSDTYVAKLSSTGKLVYEQQMGTSGSDSVAATALTSDGGLVVASVQNGHAIISKYAGGDATTTPLWTQDLGNLQNGGAIGGIAVSGNNIYVSGTTSNTALNAGGAASIATASSGGQDAFVFGLTDDGASVSANQISYVGTGVADKGGAVTVGSDGTIYLAGTTNGTFAGQSRNVVGTNNAFVAAIASNGSVNWTRQFGGADGTSTGQSVAIDTQGSSVLDALGLPRGTVTVNQSVALATSTTLRTGDSFKIALQGVGAHTGTITVAAGETLQSLAAKINNVLLTKGNATVTYAHGGETLKIAVNKGVTANLIAGPADFDALARLGLAAGTLANGAPASTNSSSTSSSSSSNTTQVFGLGFSGMMDISTSKDAGAARAQLQNVLTNIRNAYRTSNTPPAPLASTNTQTGPAPAYLTAQVANYQLALSMFPGANSSSSA
jgi:hypothetical protein